MNTSQRLLEPTSILQNCKTRIKWTRNRVSFQPHVSFPKTNEHIQTKRKHYSFSRRWSWDEILCSLVEGHVSKKTKWRSSLQLDFSCLAWLIFFHEVRLSPLGTAATVWPIVPAQNDRWWVWSSRWNANWQGKLKYSEKTCPNASLSTTNPTWPNPGRRGGKPANNHLSYGTDLASFTLTLKMEAVCSSETSANYQTTWRHISEDVINSMRWQANSVYLRNDRKIDLGEIGWDGGDWIGLAQDRDQWRALVKAVMNLRVP
jgi:hypothetical protein